MTWTGCSTSWAGRRSRVSSFGSLTHFTAANRPAGAADRCVACSVEASCPYSAPRLYRGLLDRGEHRWPLSVVIDDFSPAALDEALASGPYGRCVYACDNDAVDHQVVALEFPGAPLAPGPSPGTTTATFTMTAFSRPADRSTRLFGTRAELTGDGETIRVYDFLTRAERLITPAPAGAMNPAEGHGGGDAGLMDAFTRAVATGNPRADLLRPARVTGQPPGRLRRRTSAAERHRRKY